jgi:hypothetical protein
MYDDLYSRGNRNHESQHPRHNRVNNCNDDRMSEPEHHDKNRNDDRMYESVHHAEHHDKNCNNGRMYESVHHVQDRYQQVNQGYHESSRMKYRDYDDRGYHGYQSQRHRGNNPTTMSRNLPYSRHEDRRLVNRPEGNKRPFSDNNQHHRSIHSRDTNRRFRGSGPYGVGRHHQQNGFVRNNYVTPPDRSIPRNDLPSTNEDDKYEGDTDSEHSNLRSPKADNECNRALTAGRTETTENTSSEISKIECNDSEDYVP